LPATLHAVASLLNTSERPLKRWLHSEGTSFRDLQTASRQLRTDKLLADTRFSMADIAEMVGFSDLSTFSQAYKRWTGLAPSTARKNMQAGAEAP